MSTAAPTTDPAQASSSGKKKNNKKKKAAANKAAKEITDAANTEAASEEAQNQGPNEEGPDGPDNASPVEPKDDTTTSDKTPESQQQANGYSEDHNGHETADTPAETSPDVAATSTETTGQVDALTKERDELRTEVEKLRKRQQTQDGERGQEETSDEVAQLRSELEEATSAKEQAEEQYQGLLERVNHLKTTLGDRLKRDRVELEEAKERIEELESQNEQLQSGTREAEEQASKLKDELSDVSREAASLRSRGNLSQQNWTKERDELAKLVSNLKEEVETTTNAMGEWEVIAMEERSVKESLAEKVSELEEQTSTLRDNYQSAASERDGQATAIDNLQKALSEIQDARKRELREMVETSEEQLQALKKLVQEADKRAQEAEAARENLTKELERMAPFEKEVKEKNLLIGKLRHEAIVLNDHLTKALRYLKKTKPEDNVDRQIVTNHMLHFLTLDRSDPKRFQILQVMAGYLNWSDEQREQAGLARPGTSNVSGGGIGSSLRIPSSPFHRTPSSPALSADFFAEAGGGSGGGGASAKDKESLADLWAGFLERQAQEALSPDAADGPGRGSTSRKGSTASSSSRPEMRAS